MILAPTLTLSAGSGAAIVRPTFSRDFAGEKTLNNGTGPAITFTRGSNATFFDANGTLQTAGTNVPRFDHNPATGASLGLLIEEARTNSIRNSQAGGATVGVIGSGGALPTNWSGGANLNGVSTEVIGTGTENGLAYVDVKISGTPTGNGATYLNFEATGQVSASSGQTWTQSAYVKLAFGSVSNATVRIALGSRNTGGTPQELGTTTTFTPTSGSLASQRRSVTHIYADALTAFAYPDVRVVYTSGNPIDLTLRIAAPQLEQGAFATSYIPTTNAAATRSADSAVVTPISSFYNQAEGTLFAEAIASTTSGIASGIHQQTVVTLLESNVGDKLIALYRANSATTGRLYVGISPAQADIGQAGFTQGAITRIGGAFKTDDFAVSVNGASVSTDTSGTLPAPSTLRIGFYGASSGFLNGHIRKIAYYPKRLSNTLLQQLTT